MFRLQLSARMALTPGTKLGPYETHAPLGADADSMNRAGERDKNYEQNARFTSHGMILSHDRGCGHTGTN